MMEKKVATHHVTPISESQEDESSSSTFANGTSFPQESIPLRVLAGSGITPVTRTGDSSVTDLSASASATASKIVLEPNQTDEYHAQRPADGRPRWLQQSTRKGKQRIEWILTRPGILHVMNWIRGPSPPRPYKINPFLPKLQSWPTSMLPKYISTASGCALVTALICALWLIAFCTTLATAQKTTLNGSGAQAPIRLACVTRLWEDAPSCGTDGRDCRPFQGDAFSFICPSGCASVELLNPKTIGNETIDYKNLVIGGPSPAHGGLAIYRGDSFMCSAAVHAGVVSNKFGGCGVLNREGTQSNFPSVDQNGIQSIGFEPSFPLSFSFSPEGGNCKDPQWYALIASVCATAFVSVIATPPWLFFSTIFVIVYFQVALASDAPNAFDFATVMSTAFGSFLPAAFIGVVLYRYCVSRTMRGLTAYWERTVLWLGACWVGALNSYTFNNIPISRLTAHDLRLEPGALVALIVIVIVILAVAVGQVWAFRIEGRLLRYLKFYIIVGVIIGCLVAIPGLDLRLHHYIIGLLLLPGTSIQTRPSLLYQGVLLGLFINGVARWGFSSILQTPDVLFYGAESGSDLPEISLPNIVNDTITFTISQIADGFDGISAVVNDVELFQVTNATLPVVYNYTRTIKDQQAFIRFAFTGSYTLGGVWYGDYTEPGTWFGNGTWVPMLPGASGT